MDMSIGCARKRTYRPVLYTNVRRMRRGVRLSVRNHFCTRSFALLCCRQGKRNRSWIESGEELYSPFKNMVCREEGFLANAP